MSLQSQIDRALAGLKGNRDSERAAQLRKGTAVEMEHKRTIRRIQRSPKLPIKKAARLVAADHIRENPRYYDALEVVEGKVKKQRGLKSPRIKVIGRRGKVTIYRVDDTKVRKLFTDWTMGGHSNCYPDMIPHREVWIAGELGPPRPPLEESLTQLHELREMRRMGELMQSGMSRSDAYEKAHDESLAVEDKYRKANGRGLKGALARERGWQGGYDFGTPRSATGGKRRSAPQRPVRPRGATGAHRAPKRRPTGRVGASGGQVEGRLGVLVADVNRLVRGR